ncbi:hypothetical protein ACNRWW_16925 [Metabacillus sp. HB246100]
MNTRKNWLMKKEFVFIIALVTIFLLVNSNPSMAVRTHVFFMGYPKAALTSGIVEDDYHNKVDKDKFVDMNAKAYTLTEPPIEKATQGELRNFLVRKYGFLYLAEYYGDT